MTPAVPSLEIQSERDLVLARQRARQLAALLGFDGQDQTRIATAVSEIARNAFSYAGGGRVEFRLEGVTAPQVFVVEIADRGSGIPDVSLVLEGSYRSPTGMGIGILGARRLMDQFSIASSPQGTTVVLKKFLPRTAPAVSGEQLGRIVDELARQAPRDPVVEVQQQNQELLRALAELSRRQEELRAVNSELEDTNRGVVALYAELDEKADHLRRADEVKSRFLSNMSHEFRTPVNSIQALARLLLERSDGELTAEQEKQVTFIQKAADQLCELVNDLLDLAKVEAGKVVVRPVEFEVTKLFGALRGMLRPLLVNESVSLVFQDADDLPRLYTDEAKVSQILRNFISNALKFTERGVVRVAARPLPGRDAVAFSVADTGIGIASEDQERIFQDFTQVENPLQRRVKGTGLGLPLCRKLAALLGGSVEVESRPGVGSTFTAIIPLMYEAAVIPPETWEPDPRRTPVLVVEDSAETVLVYDKFLARLGFQLIPARSVRAARAALKAMRPKAIILDILLRGEDAWDLLAELKRDDATKGIPVVVATTVDDERKAIALGADAYCIKPIDRQRLVDTLTALTAPARTKRVLVVDDDDVARYVLRHHLTAGNLTVSEAATGAEALDLARAERPDAICLDLVMSGLDGGAVLERLKADAATRSIPVVVVTSKLVDEAERRRLLQHAVAILSKRVSPEQLLAAVEQATTVPTAA